MLSHVLADGEAPVVRVDIPDLEVSGTAAQFAAPVHVSNGEGIRGAEIRVAYDTTLLTTNVASIQPGALWAGVQTELVVNVDEATGTIEAWVFSAEALDATAGSLLEIVFQTVRAPVVGETTILDLSFVRLNEDLISVDPASQPGLDETDGLVTFIDAEATVVRVDIPDMEVPVTAVQFAAPVHVSNGQGIRGAEIRLAYDISLLRADVGNVQPGALWDGVQTELVVNIDETTGIIDAWVFSTEELGAAAGSLLEIVFQTVRTPVDGETTVLDLSFVRLNEGQIGVQPVPQPGFDETDGVVTFVGVPVPEFGTLGGFVYADTNNNSQPDPTEGVPGVKIMLVDVGGIVAAETWTDQHGWYEFRDVPPGTYQIRQRQPASMIDGGPNEIDVQLAAEQSRLDLHFRELGLRPEFVYTRLLAASTQPPGSPAWTSVVSQIEADAQVQAGNSADPAPPPVSTQIVQEASEVVVQGGNGDDYFRFEAGAAVHTITLNEETRQYPAAEVTSIRFDGGLGIDTVELIGISAQDQADLSPKTAVLQGAGYTMVVTASESISIRSTGPGDEVRWSDSPVDDVLRAEPSSARLDAFHSSQEVAGFRRVVALSQRGGQDQVLRSDTLDYVLEQSGPWLPGAF